MRLGAGGCVPTADREQQYRYGCHNAGRSLSTESTLSTPDPLHLQPPPVQHGPPAYRSLNAPHAAAPKAHFRCAAIPLNRADPRPAQTSVPDNARCLTERRLRIDLPQYREGPHPTAGRTHPANISRMISERMTSVNTGPRRREFRESERHRALLGLRPRAPYGRPYGDVSLLPSAPFAGASETSVARHVIEYGFRRRAHRHPARRGRLGAAPATRRG